MPGQAVPTLASQIEKLLIPGSIMSCRVPWHIELGVSWHKAIPQSGSSLVNSNAP
jgi:hypothetical protein